MDISNLIEMVGTRCGVSLSMPPGGTLSMTFEGDLAINLEHDIEQDVLHLYCVMGADPADDRSQLALYRQMLEANLFGHDTAGAALALDQGSGEVLLTRRVEIGALNGDLLHELLQSMARCATELKERLFATTEGGGSLDDFAAMMGGGRHDNLLA